ncbi:MAG: 23S rRNA (guanosine(2251)-2'-O)-methyltransferase RlmB, partial [Chloroflexi bacterium]|nr:23S rRNA (guanosine(2251)-2'-O)-methyltransferase RlmB [Chloroflexota bacterium]
MTEIIAGRNPVLEALKANRPVSKILLDRDARRHGAITEMLQLARDRGIPVERVDARAIDRHAPDIMHQGVIAYAAVKDYASLEELLAIPKEKNEPPLFLVLDGIEDPQNLGAILRTAETTGIHGVIIRSRRAAGLTPAVAKASAGAIEYVPVARVANISQAVETLKKQGAWVVGIDMAGAQDYTRVDFKLPIAIVIGAEGKGLSDLVRK